MVVPNSFVDVETDETRRIGVVDENVSLSDLIDGLSALGVSPRNLIDILKAVRAAGALHADLEII